MIQLSDEYLEAISYILGCSSVLIWFCAQLPQIVKNWRKKSVEGLSSGFLLAWVAGDTSNLFGCLLTGQLGVQVLLASYFCFVDLVLITQFSVYTQNPSDIAVVNGYNPLADEDMHDNTNHIFSKPRTSSIAKNIYVKLGSIISTGAIMGRSSAAPVVSTDVTLVADENILFSFVKSVILMPTIFKNDWSSLIGYIVAYFSMCMYLTSRIPQIYHNFTRKSTTGVSMLLFLFAVLGNLTYVLSIVLSPYCIGRGAEKRQFLIKELSYILGALGTIVFDCIILGQWHWYKLEFPHRRRSTAPFDRIQRPYLGTGGSSTDSAICSTPTLQPYEPTIGSPPSLSLLNDSNRYLQTIYGGT